MKTEAIICDHCRKAIVKSKPSEPIDAIELKVTTPKDMRIYDLCSECAKEFVPWVRWKE